MTEIKIKKKKNNVFSIAKGIGIILMIIGHSGSPYKLRVFINLFHMSLFFFISGYFYKEEYINNIFTFILKKIKSLYVPFVIYSIIFLLLHNLFYKLNIYNNIYSYNGHVSFLYSSKDFIEKIKLIFFHFGGNDQLLGALWFLKSLFLANLIYFFCHLFAFKISKNHNTIILGFIILFILLPLGYIMKLKRITLPMGIQREFIFLSFLFIGYLYKKCRLTIHQNRYLPIILFAFLLIISNFYTISIFDLRIPNPIELIIISLSGFLMIIGVSYHLNKISISAPLVYIGNNTMPILIFHFLSFKLASLLKILYYQFDISQLSKFPVILENNTYWWIIYSIIGISGSLFVNLIIIKSKAYIFKLMPILYRKKKNNGSKQII